MDDVSKTINANCSIFSEWEIPDSHQNIFIVKTELLFVDLTDKLISNIFSGVKMDFRFLKKSEQLALILKRYLRLSTNLFISL